MPRRVFLRRCALSPLALGGTVYGSGKGRSATRPNVLFILADQWRAQAVGWGGDPNVRTTNLDRLARESVRFSQCVSGCPVCSPYRASLMTGRYPLSHGVFLNDVYLKPEAVSLARAFSGAGYDTAYIGKWHLDGHGSRSAYIPPERRQGFRFWRALECTHRYNRSFYYADGEKEKRVWEGYDAIAQTREAIRYLRRRPADKPFLLCLSWGPPHAPYHTAPEKYRRRFDPGKIRLRPNVPERHRDQARKDLAGYYAHISALDECVGTLLSALKSEGLEENTIVVFTSDHGDMLWSQGRVKKQQPWDESILVPFLLRYPARLGRKERIVPMRLNSPDIMPTLLGLSGIGIPDSVEGVDLSKVVLGVEKPRENAALITCPSPFGQWSRRRGGKEYRGVRTARYTYVRDLEGPWLLYDNEKDPYQLRNLCRDPAYAAVRAELEKVLREKLRETKDEFRPGPDYIAKWGYKVDATGTVPYRP